MHAILRRLSELTGNSQSSMVGELLQSSQHVFERMAAVLEAAHKLKAEGMKAPDQMRESLEAAQAKLETQLGIAYDHIDEGFRPILDEAEKVSRRAGAGAGTGRRSARPAPAPAPARGQKPPISNRGVTPRENPRPGGQKAVKAVTKSPSSPTGVKGAKPGRAKV